MGPGSEGIFRMQPSSHHSPELQPATVHNNSYSNVFKQSKHSDLSEFNSSYADVMKKSSWINHGDLSRSDSVSNVHPLGKAGTSIQDESNLPGKSGNKSPTYRHSGTSHSVANIRQNSPTSLTNEENIFKVSQHSASRALRPTSQSLSAEDKTYKSASTFDNNFKMNQSSQNSSSMPQQKPKDDGISAVDLTAQASSSRISTDQKCNQPPPSGNNSTAQGIKKNLSGNHVSSITLSSVHLSQDSDHLQPSSYINSNSKNIKMVLESPDTRTQALPSRYNDTKIVQNQTSEQKGVPQHSIKGVTSSSCSTSTSTPRHISPNGRSNQVQSGTNATPVLRDSTSVKASSESRSHALPSYGHSDQKSNQRQSSNNKINLQQGTKGFVPSSGSLHAQKNSSRNISDTNAQKHGSGTNNTSQKDLKTNVTCSDIRQQVLPTRVSKDTKPLTNQPSDQRVVPQHCTRGVTSSSCSASTSTPRHISPNGRSDQVQSGTNATPVLRDLKPVQASSDSRSHALPLYGHSDQKKVQKQPKNNRINLQQGSKGFIPSSGALHAQKNSCRNAGETNMQKQGPSNSTTWQKDTKMATISVDKRFQVATSHALNTQNDSHGTCCSDATQKETSMFSPQAYSTVFSQLPNNNSTDALICEILENDEINSSKNSSILQNTQELTAYASDSDDPAFTQFENINSHVNSCLGSAITKHNVNEAISTSGKEWKTQMSPNKTFNYKQNAFFVETDLQKYEANTTGVKHSLCSKTLLPNVSHIDSRAKSKDQDPCETQAKHAGLPKGNVIDSHLEFKGNNIDSGNSLVGLSHYKPAPFHPLNKTDPSYSKDSNVELKVEDPYLDYFGSNWIEDFSKDDKDICVTLNNETSKASQEFMIIDGNEYCDSRWMIKVYSKFVFVAMATPLNGAIDNQVLVLNRYSLNDQVVSRKDAEKMAVEAGASESSLLADAILGIIATSFGRFLVVVLQSEYVCSIKSCKVFVIKKPLCIPFSADSFEPRRTSDTVHPESDSIAESASKWITSQFQVPSITGFFSDHQYIDQNISSRDPALKVVKPNDILKYVNGIEKILLVGMYYSFEYNLTMSMQKTEKVKAASDETDLIGIQLQEKSIFEMSDLRFCWNAYMALPLPQRWRVPLMQGHISHTKVEHGVRDVDLILILRRSRLRGGTRYNARGIDDVGNVANYVESELLVKLGPSKCWASLVQARGSVPVFWEQTGLTAQTSILRSAALTTNAFKIHQNFLNTNYGSCIYYLNLLSSTRVNEIKLTNALEQQLGMFKKDCNEKYRSYLINYDFHQQVKNKDFETALSDFVRVKLRRAFEDCGYFKESEFFDGAERWQDGVIRTNCLDCLDRTNIVQWYYSWVWLKLYLFDNEYQNFVDNSCDGQMRFSSLPASLENSSNTSNSQSNAKMPTDSYRTTDESKESTEDVLSLSTAFKHMWADSGDSISIQYTCTGSIFSSTLRQGKSVSSNIDHAIKSLGRFYQNNFEDAFRQECLDMILGIHRMCISDPNITFRPLETQRIQSPLSASLLEIEPTNFNFQESNLQSYTVWCGTWNLAGLDAFEITDFEEWILASENGLHDIYMFCFQEVVDLSAIRVLMNIKDRDKEERLEKRLEETLTYLSKIKEGSRDRNAPHKACGYVKIQYCSTVGMYVVVFIRSSLKDYLTEVQSCPIKLGLKGNTGNKGAVCISFVIHTTSMCFINVHLASGRQNPFERLNQMSQIVTQAFQGGRTPHAIANHHYVFASGDFNFRLHMDREDVMAMISIKSYESILRKDQFSLCRQHKLPPFGYFSEADIAFPPTYKFRKASMAYDTRRCPAWCDRVLWGGRIGRLTSSTMQSFGIKPFEPLKVLYYKCHPYLQMSDHRPVSCAFEIKVSKGNEFHELLRYCIYKKSELETETKLLVDERNESREREIFGDCPVDDETEMLDYVNLDNNANSIIEDDALSRPPDLENMDELIALCEANSFVSPLPINTQGLVESVNVSASFEPIKFDPPKSASTRRSDKNNERRASRLLNLRD